MQLPLSVFGIAVAAAILPSTSRAGARKDYDEIRQTLAHGLRQTFFLVLPALLGLILLRRPIVSLLFERGAFSAADTEQASTALLFYGLGLLSFVWVKVLAAGFYSIQDTKTPVIVASASMLLNILLNCVLVGPLGYRGLALATTLSFTVNFLFLFVLLSDRFGVLLDKAALRILWHISIAAGIMAAVAYGAYIRTHQYFPETTLLDRAICVLLPLACAIGSYVALCALLNVPDLRYFLALGRRRK